MTQRAGSAQEPWLLRPLGVLLGVLLGGLLTSACSDPHRNVATIEDAKHARLGVMTGSVGESIAHTQFAEADIKSFDDIMEAVSALKAQHLDAVITAYTTAFQVAKKNPDLGILKDHLTDEESSIAIAKDNPELLRAIDEAVAGLKADGTLDQMRARWVKEDLAPYERVPLAMPTTGPPLKVGVSATREPLQFVQNGEYIGLDRELMERIAVKLGRPMEFVDMKFSAVIPSLKSGKIDIIGGSIIGTAERRKSVDFSVPYFANPQILLVRKSTDPGGEAGTSWLSRVAASFESNIMQERRYLLLWDGLKVTALISLLSTVFGTTLGALVCFLRMSPRRALRWPARAYIAIIRGIPVVVLLMLIFYVVFASVNINPVLVAVVAFGMNFAAYVSEMFRTGIEGVDRGQTEAGIAMGFTPAQTFGYIVLPQMVRRVLPVYKGEFISLVKMTSIVGYIAVQDITKASDIIRSRTFDAFFPLVMVAVLYFAIAGILTQGLDYLERATDPKARRTQGASR